MLKVFVVASIVALIGFLARLQLRTGKGVWTVVTAGNVNNISGFSEYESVPSERIACEIGLRLLPPIFIRRPNGTIYQLSFRPEDHITDNKIHATMDAKPTEYEKLVSEMERHVRDCEQCRQQHFRAINAVRQMRSPNLPLLQLGRRATTAN